MGTGERSNHEVVSILGHADVIRMCQIKEEQLAGSYATYGCSFCTKNILNGEIYDRKKETRATKKPLDNTRRGGLQEDVRNEV